MTIAAFVPQIWTTKILRTLEDNLIAKKICSMEPEGEIKKAGDTVYFNGLSDPTIRDYAGSVTYEGLQDAGVTMNIDQQKYFAFKVGDIEKAQANVDLKGSQAERSAYKLRETADSFILGKHGDANSQIVGTITTSNVLSKIGEMQQKLSEANVSESEMWMVAPPWMRLKLQLAGIKFSINEGFNGTGGVAWTKELGFTLYVTNQVVNTGTIDVPVSKVMAGAYNSIVYADQIIETESLRLESSFDNGVRGLHVYGGKTVRPDLMVTGTFTFAAETTI
ncbi:hypothetical protein BK133_00810 [Paenibacillus sp. FSL H8-0548]|uniref:hypothetical protein n=1 Tax=Paenibacillus sp. FSL H8-0548 TaxID=1920422 RepID=UPI00096FD8FC|nr:hypothetical protein [Paenibacillus sp. FSL H8-0548]OMF38777.1 hypothetical protein BK133_00810 [Paenibacillus sp. FSL H8-0548]